MIYARRSIRRFTPEPVAPGTVEELMRAAMAAPSAKDRQPWRFLVITDAAKRKAMAEQMPFAQFAVESPVVVILFGTPEGALFDQDIAAATENLLIAAAALGLGTCWCGVTDERRPALHAITGIPAELRISAMVCLGHPGEEKEPRSQYDPAKVYYEEYG